jgi:hypothetical protein
MSAEELVAALEERYWAYQQLLSRDHPNLSEMGGKYVYEAGIEQGMRTSIYFARGAAGMDTGNWLEGPKE